MYFKFVIHSCSDVQWGTSQSNLGTLSLDYNRNSDMIKYAVFFKIYVSKCLFIFCFKITYPFIPEYDTN